MALRWWHFWDMHSGGDQKGRFHHYFIQATSTEDAESFFYALTGRSPHTVTCDCCGPDFAITDGETLAAITAYHRRARWVRNADGAWEQREEPDPEHPDEFILLPRYVETSGRKLKLVPERDTHLIVFYEERSRVREDYEASL